MNRDIRTLVERTDLERMTHDELVQLNEELQRRLSAAETMLAEIRAEAIARQAEVRRLADSLPAQASRSGLIKAMIRDARMQPNKGTMVLGAVRKVFLLIARRLRRVAQGGGRS